MSTAQKSSSTPKPVGSSTKQKIISLAFPPGTIPSGIIKLSAHQHWILPLLLSIILITPLLLRRIAGVPLLRGGESYAHMISANALLGMEVPPIIFLIIPLVFAVSAYILFIAYSRLRTFDPVIQFISLCLLFLSPAFIQTFTEFTLYALALVLLLAAALLLRRNKTLWAIVVLLPLFWIDTLSVFMGVFVVLFNVPHSQSFWTSRENNETPSKTSRERALPKTTAGFIFSVLLVLFIISLLIGRPLFLGPFHSESLFGDVMSDLGGFSGMSIFILVLALLGIVEAWRRKNRVPVMLFFVLLGVFIANTHSIIFFALVALGFAVLGFHRIFSKEWVYPPLKHLALFIVFLGILFSLLSYLDRITDVGPTAEDLKALAWMRDYIPNEAVIFSTPDYGYYIKALAQKTPAYFPEDRRSSVRISKATLDALYVRDLFPLLEEQGITHLYIHNTMKEILPSDKGLLFLLKNERFKLIYSSGETEVWQFTPTLQEQK